MRRARKDTQASLDSLLDTMTNVVGILVILLVMTQLGVSGAIRRIRGLDIELVDVGPKDIAEARRQAAELEAALVPLRDQAAPAEQAIAAAPVKLEDVDLMIARLNRALNDPDAAALDVEPVRQTVEQRRQQVAQLETQLKEVDQQLDQVRTALEAVPRRPAPPPKIVRLPNPRAAPKELQPVYFVLRGERVAAVPLEGLQRLAQSHVNKALQGKLDPKKTDCDRLVAYFQSQNVGNRTFQLKIHVYNYRPYLELHLRPGAGEPLDQIEHPSSQFQREIRKAQPTRQYARFLVWGDSFDLYQTARRLADERGLSAGWVPFAPNQNWRASLGVNLTCEGKPPPKPPPPKPAKPTPKPPERRPLPDDQID